MRRRRDIATTVRPRSRTARRLRARRRRRGVLVCLTALAALALSTVGGTWAAFSDFATTEDNRAGAGTLVLDPQAVTVALEVDDRGQDDRATLTVGNVGTVDADIRVVVDAATSVLCPDADGLDLQLGGRPLCSLLGNTGGVLVGTGVTPPGTVAVAATLVLDDEATFARSGLTDTFPLRFQARQHGTDQGFSDFTTGELVVTIGEYAPDVLDACTEDLGRYRIIEVLGNGRHHLDLSHRRGPALVLARHGSKHITGTAQDDCILVEQGTNWVSGGRGDDWIIARNGRNELYGDEGGDTIHSLHGTHEIHGGDGDDHVTVGHGKVDVFGGSGDDRLEAAYGKITLDGGPDVDHCETTGPGDVTTAHCELPAGTTQPTGHLGTADPFPAGGSQLRAPPLPPIESPDPVAPTLHPVESPDREDAPVAPTTDEPTRLPAPTQPPPSDSAAGTPSPPVGDTPRPPDRTEPAQPTPTLEPTTAPPAVPSSVATM